MRSSLLRNLILGVSLLQGLWAIYNYGYMGQDFGTHSYWGTEPRFHWFNFSLPNSPVFYWLPKILSELLGPHSFFELQALIYLALNTWALALIWRILPFALSALELQVSAFLLITFLPTRVIHSLVFAADAFTIFPFFALLLLVERLLRGNSAPPSPLWKKVSFWSSFGVLMKYSMIALWPALAAVAWARRRIDGKKALIPLALPFLLFAVHMGMSYHHKSYTTTTHWKDPSAPSKMNWNDIFFLKAQDRDLFLAPEYFHSSILESHRYSYPALLHLATFTDVMNWFQEVPESISRRWGSRTAEVFERTRSSFTLRVSRVLLYAALPLSLLMLLGIIVHLKLALRSLFIPDLLGIWMLFALGFHALMVMNFPKLAEPYQWGYWLPRYVIPSILTYLVFGIRLLEKAFPCVRKAALLYALFLSTLMIAVL